MIPAETKSDGTIKKSKNLKISPNRTLSPDISAGADEDPPNFLKKCGTSSRKNSFFLIFLGQSDLFFRIDLEFLSTEIIFILVV